MVNLANKTRRLNVDLDPVYTVPDLLVTTSSFAAQEQRLTTKVYSFDNFRMFLLVTTIINV
jgi:hypothetical protein